MMFIKIAKTKKNVYIGAVTVVAHTYYITRQIPW